MYEDIDYELVDAIEELGACPACGGEPPFVLLGVLGNLAHLRCRDCGSVISIDWIDLKGRDKGTEA